MKRFYVAKCWDGSSIEGAKKPWSWDVVDRLGSTESTLCTVSSHQSRVLARAEADELNNCQRCSGHGAYRNHDHRSVGDTVAALPQGEDGEGARGVPPASRDSSSPTDRPLRPLREDS